MTKTIEISVDKCFDCIFFDKDFCKKAEKFFVGKSGNYSLTDPIPSWCPLPDKETK